MDTIISTNRLIDLCRKYAMLGLVFLLYLKFVVQIVFESSFVVLDIFLYLLLILSLNFKKVRRSIIFTLIIAAISILNPVARNIFLIFLTSYILCEFRLDTFLKLNLFFALGVFVLCSIFILLGITHSEMFKQSIFDTRVRWDYGMGNPNTFSLFVYSILINIYLIFGQKYKWAVALIALIGYLTYSYTGSRTFCIAVVILIVVHLLRSFLAGLRIVRLGLQFSPLIIFFLVFFFANKVADYPIANFVLSGRLELYNTFLNSLSVTDYIIGTPLINDETIDSSFLHLYFESGAFTFLAFVIMFYITIKRATKKEMKVYIPLFCSYFAIGVTESVLTFILIFGNMIVWLILFQTLRGRHLPDDLCR